MNQDINIGVLSKNLENYVDFLIENYYCQTYKKPSILVELRQKMFGLENLLDVSKVPSTDYELKNNLDNIITLLETSNIEEKELNLLKNNINREWNSFNNEKMKKIEEELKSVMKLTEKAIKKFPELSRDNFKLHENNITGIEEVRKQVLERWSSINTTIDFYSLYKDSFSKETITFDRGMEDYFQYLQQQINKVESNKVTTEEIKFIDNMQEEKKIVDEYEKLVSNGKVQVSNNKTLTFFGKFGFQPLRKQISVREILEKISQTDYTLDLLDNAIKVIRENKGGVDFSKTLEELHNLRKKYSVIYNKLRDDLKNSNYDEMKKAVEQERELKRQEEIKKLNQQKVKILYKKILKSSDDEEIKQLLKEIRLVELSEDEKEQAKNDASDEYKTELENKEIERKIIQAEYNKIKEYEKEVADGLRKRAIQALKLEGAFASDYHENGLDVRDSMTPEKKEDLIQRKMQELSRENKITKQEQALQDLKDQGFVKREDATLQNLKPYERDALEAQMRINARAEEEQKTGYRK